MLVIGLKNHLITILNHMFLVLHKKNYKLLGFDAFHNNIELLAVNLETS